MTELFDYGENRIPPSPEVTLYALDMHLLHTDWRQRASEYFREVEAGRSKRIPLKAIGALGLALSQEKTQKTHAAEINYLEALLEMEFHDPDN